MISVGALLAEVPGLEDDGTLGDLIVRATAFVETQTGRHFGVPTDEPVFLSGSGTRNLWLPESPMDSDYPEPAVVIGRPYPGGPETEYALDVDYSIRTKTNDAYLVRLGGDCWRAGHEFEVSYLRGYEVDAGPGDVRQLILNLCSMKLSNRGAEGIRSESIGQDYSYTRFAAGDLDALPGGRATVESWRRLVYA